MESPRSDNRKKKYSAFISSSLFKNSARVGLHGLRNEIRIKLPLEHGITEK
jgi:hypothetical protein